MQQGCKYGLPHNVNVLYENPRVKWEVCIICNKKFRWNKGYKERIKNKDYLKVHVRNFAQPNGATKRVYMQIYKPEKTIINL